MAVAQRRGLGIGTPRSEVGEDVLNKWPIVDHSSYPIQPPVGEAGSLLRRGGTFFAAVVGMRGLGPACR
jgi:hypothetical protein